MTKKLLYCCSLVLGLSALFVEAGWSLPTCNTFYARCCTKTSIFCISPYNCNQTVDQGKSSSFCTPSGSNNLFCSAGDFGCPYMAMAKKDGPTESKPSTLLAKLLDAIAAPAHATNCWSGGANFGVRNGVNQSGFNGTTRQCEAKLHVCFTNGSADAAIPCTVNTTGGCDNACTNVSDIACNTTDVNGLTYCQSRCYAARVNGYSDTCD